MFSTSVCKSCLSNCYSFSKNFKSFFFFSEYPFGCFARFRSFSKFSLSYFQSLRLVCCTSLSQSKSFLSSLKRSLIRFKLSLSFSQSFFKSWNIYSTPYQISQTFLSTSKSFLSSVISSLCSSYLRFSVLVSFYCCIIVCLSLSNCCIIYNSTFYVFIDWSYSFFRVFKCLVRIVDSFTIRIT